MPDDKPVPPPADTPAQPSPKPAQAPAAPQPGQAPPAAEIVLKGGKTERESALESETKTLQTRLSELEDENRQLKTIPKPKDPPARQKKSWLSGLTFFDED